MLRNGGIDGHDPLTGDRSVRESQLAPVFFSCRAASSAGTSEKWEPCYLHVQRRRSHQTPAPRCILSEVALHRQTPDRRSTNWMALPQSPGPLEYSASDNDSYRILGSQADIDRIRNSQNDLRRLRNLSRVGLFLFSLLLTFVLYKLVARCETVVPVLLDSSPEVLGRSTRKPRFACVCWMKSVEWRLICPDGGRSAGVILSV